MRIVTYDSLLIHVGQHFPKRHVLRVDPDGTAYVNNGLATTTHALVGEGLPYTKKGWRMLTEAVVFPKAQGGRA
jgi:hypothetical protein